jgi:tetratricopeptide (TPR) repeat protein
MTVGEGQAGRETWPRTPLRFRPRSSDAGFTPYPLVVLAELLSAHFSPTTTTWSRGRRSEGRQSASTRTRPFRPFAAPPNSGGHKLGHNFEPAQADPGHGTEYYELFVSIEVSLEKGRGSLRAGRFREAIKHFDLAIDADPDSVEGHLRRAEALDAMGRFNEAIEDLERVVAAKMVDGSAASNALFSIGNCYVKLGDLPRAVEYFDRTLAAAPFSDQVWHNQGMAFLNLGRLEQAAGCFARAAEANPASVRTCLWQGHCLHNLGRDDEADECFARAAQTNAVEEIAQVWMQIGQHLQEGGSLERAVEAYDHALDLSPTWDVAWLTRGVCLALLTRDDEAEAAFNEAIALDGLSKLSALANLGGLLMRRGRRKEAAAVYDRVLDVPPSAVRDHIERARVLLALGRFDDALTATALARRLDPTNPNVRHLEGVCLEALGRFAEAADTFGSLVRVQSHHIEAWRRRARCLMIINENEEARFCCEKAIALGDATGEVSFVHGCALAQLGQLEEAASSFEESLSVGPSAEGARMSWINLGSCYQQLDRYSDAVVAFEHALAISPSDVSAIRGVATSFDAMGRSKAAYSWAATGLALELFDTDSGQAVARIVQAIELDSSNWLATRLRGDIHLAVGEHEEAILMYQRVLELRPNDANTWTSLGTELVKVGRADEATACYNRALKADPSSPACLRNMGIDLLEHGLPADALAVYERAIAVDYENGNAWYGKGVALYRLHRRPEAVEAFRRAVALLPDDTEIWKDLGTCLACLGRYREASEAWGHVERLESAGDAQAEEQRRLMMELGIRTILPGVGAVQDDVGEIWLPGATEAYACARNGDHVTAVEAFASALTADPTRTDLWIDRGISAEIAEGPERAIECFDEALRLDPESIGAWYNRGVSLMKIERFDEALAAFEKAVKLHGAKELSPDLDLLHGLHNMALCLVSFRRWEEALDNLDEVIQVARDAPERWREESDRAEDVKRDIFSFTVVQ